MPRYLVIEVTLPSGVDESAVMARYSDLVDGTKLFPGLPHRQEIRDVPVLDVPTEVIENHSRVETYEQALERWIRWLSDGPKVRYRHSFLEPHFRQMLADRYVAMSFSCFVLTDIGRAYGVEHGWIALTRSTEAI